MRTEGETDGRTDGQTDMIKLIVDFRSRLLPARLNEKDAMDRHV
jgi:hypothetical protein